MSNRFYYCSNKIL